MKSWMDIPWCGPGRFKIIVWLILFTVLGCKENQAGKDADLEGDLEKSELPEGFMGFLDQFGKNSIFQMNHIQWPLEVQRALSEEGEEPEMISLDPANWRLQKTFDDMQGTYTQQFINFNGIVTELTADKSGQYTMIRRFSKIDGDWKLIFYKEMGL